MTEPMEDETWRDARGPVRVAWVRIHTWPFTMARETTTRVSYARDGRTYMLGLRRFLRDFQRSNDGGGR